MHLPNLGCTVISGSASTKGVRWRPIAALMTVDLLVFDNGTPTLDLVFGTLIIGTLIMAVFFSKQRGDRQRAGHQDPDQEHVPAPTQCPPQVQRPHDVLAVDVTLGIPFCTTRGSCAAFLTARSLRPQRGPKRGKAP